MTDQIAVDEFVKELDQRIIPQITKLINLLARKDNDEFSKIKNKLIDDILRKIRIVKLSKDKEDTDSERNANK